MLRITLLLVLLEACDFPRPADVPDIASDASRIADSRPPRCDVGKPFSSPTLLENVSSVQDEFGFSLTHDELTAFVGRLDTGRLTLYASRRASIMAPFGTPDDHLTAAINTSGGVISGSVTADGLIFYFHRQNPQMPTDIAVLAARRLDGEASFDAGIPVTVDGAPLVGAIGPKISADGRTLYWVDYPNNIYGRVFAANSTANFSKFIGKRIISLMSIESEPVLSADELMLYYSLDNTSNKNVFVTKRMTKTDLFDVGALLFDVNSTADDMPAALTEDDCILYVISQRPGGVNGEDVWEARKPR